MKRHPLTVTSVAVLALLWIGFALPASAQVDEPLEQEISVPVRDIENFERARVLEASEPREAAIPGTNVQGQSQIITAEVLEGPDKGMTPTFQNDFTQLEVGDEFYIRHSVGALDGTDLWSVSDPYRLDILWWLAGIFVVLLVLVGGAPGIRGLASLFGSMALIFYLLLPAIYAGYSPILVSIGVASLIIVVGSYVTHGFNRTTTVAMLGMIVTVLVVGAATYFVIDVAALSGFTSETNVYLNFNTDGKISMVGLLFGGIMIGLLGVLYDIAIGQAIAVEELYRAGAHYTRREALKRGLRIGREHIGALVNTLAIAYVGVSLPLLLLFKQSDSTISFILNGEIFATEIVRILMGSIGLVLAVPLTTLLAAYMLYGRVSADTPSTSHSHSHS